MKKLMILAVMFGVVSVASVQASTQVTNSQTPGYYLTSQEKVEIKAEDLPEAVRRTLTEDSYKDWTVSKAYSVTDDKGTHYYEVALVKGEETATVKLDKEGKVLE